MLTKRKKVIRICIITTIACVLLVLCAFKLYRHLMPSKVISDLCYGKSKTNDSTVYVKENGEYVPYIVIDTDNYGEDNVLLMRKDAYMKEMMYRDENAYGAGGAYYNGCIVDDFLENEFYSFFSDGMKNIIINAPVKIHSFNYVSKRKNIGDALLETISRHVFVLSRPECSPYTDVPYEFEDTDEGAVIPAVYENPIPYHTWLRSEELGGDDTGVSVCYKGHVTANHIQGWKNHYVRPVFIVKANEPIKLSDNILNGFIFVADK